MKTVYFNQWFSSIANVIKDMKSQCMVRIIASSRMKDHVYRCSVEEDWIETSDTDKSMQNYVEWVLHLCKTENVDIFFVKKNAMYIMHEADKFKQLGVTLISDDYDTLRKIENKSCVYDILADDKYVKSFIPEYHVFKNSQGAIAYIEKHRMFDDICLKFNKDEGGTSFRAIKDRTLQLGDLYHYDLNTVTSDEAIHLVSNADSDTSKLLFMEMLDSPEISIDCYNSCNGFIALARMKVAGRKQKLFYNSELSDICMAIGNRLGLKFPYNVQFRVTRNGNVENINDLRLLEVNPRMSGGLYYEVECGKNIAVVCLLDMCGYVNAYDINEFINFDNVYLSHIEKAIIIGP